MAPIHTWLFWQFWLSCSGLEPGSGPPQHRRYQDRRPGRHGLDGLYAEAARSYRGARHHLQEQLRRSAINCAAGGLHLSNAVAQGRWRNVVSDAGHRVALPTCRRWGRGLQAGCHLSFLIFFFAALPFLPVGAAFAFLSGGSPRRFVSPSVRL
jgi:hypothetical protein